MRPLRAALALASLSVLISLTFSASGPAVAHPHAAASVTPSAPVIAAAGDIACDPGSSLFDGGTGVGAFCRAGATAKVLKAIAPDAVLPLGDEQYEDGTLKKFRKSYALSWGHQLPITEPVPGNHEYYASSTAKGYFTYFGSAAATAGRGWYSYDLGSWHLIALNSNCDQVGCGSGSAQYDWLKADLKTSTAACTLAYWHHPRFSSGPHGPNTWVLPFWRLLYGYGADVVLNGHDHDYERFYRLTPGGALDPTNGIQEFVVGTGGAQHYAISSVAPHSAARNDSTFGVLRMVLRDSSYTWRFMPALGATYSDTGTMTCHGAPA